ncbi:membrane protein insertion efficiency factor YidD [Erysipelotrichaceae bacterium 51-3]
MLESPTPSLQEQWEVYAYVMERKLPRPMIDWKQDLGRVAFWITASMIAASLTVQGLLTLSYRIGLLGWVEFHPVFLGICITFGILAAVVLVYLRAILIEMVRIYQRLAPERIRRRCLCMPTCSEYALLVLETEKLPQALRKITIRLHRTCKGSIYKIDRP